MGWPSATRFVTALPLRLPPAPDGPVPAEARAVTASAVISPLKIESLGTSGSALADAVRSTLVFADAVVEAALTTDPSPGYANALVRTGWAAGGEVTAGVVLSGWPGTAILIAQASAAAPGAR